MIRHSDLLCTCMQYGPAEMLVLWRRRVTPVVRRLMVHGHGVNHRHMAETVRLILLVEQGGVEVTSAKNWNRSHHLPECPCNPRRTPVHAVTFDSVSTEALCPA